MKNFFSDKTIKNFIIIIDSLIPLFISTKSADYFYYPKITAIYILVSCCIFVLFITYKKGNLKFKTTPELILLLLFETMVMLSTAFSQYKNQAIWGRPLRNEGMMAYISYFAILYLSFICVKDDMSIFQILKFILISGCIISMIGIMQYLGLDIVPKDTIRKDWIYTSYSTLGNPNFLGSYLSAVFPIALFMYLLNIKQLDNKFLFAANVILFSGLVCTKTRSAWLGTIISISFIVMLSVSKIKWNNKRKVASLMVSLVICTFLLNNVHGGILYSRFKSIITDYKTVVSNDEADDNKKLIAGSQRIFIWDRTMNYIFDRPLLGSGPDTFDKVFKMNSDEAEYHFGSPAVFVDKAHNEYLQIAVTLGFPALMFYILFLIMVYFKSIYYIIHGNRSNIILCIFAGCLSYAIQAFFNISVVSVAPVYWSLLGILLAECYQLKHIQGGSAYFKI